MAKTISTLAYQITADTRSFVEGLAATKKELQAAEKIMAASRTDADRYADGLQGIQQLAEKLPKDLFDAAKAVKALNHEFAHLTPVELVPEVDKRGFLKKNFGGMLPVFDPISMGTDIAGQSLQAYASIAGTVADQLGQSFERIEGIGNAAQSLNMGVEQFQILKYAADQADIEVGTLEKGLYNLQKTLATAGADESLSKQLKQLGLDAKQLKQLDPGEQYREVQEALSKIPNAADKAALSNKLFGKAAYDMGRISAEALDESEKKLRSMNGIISADGINAVGELGGAWKELHRDVEMLIDNLAVKLAPSMKNIVEDMDRVLTDERTIELLDRLGNKAAAAVDKAAIVADVGEVPIGIGAGLLGGFGSAVLKQGAGIDLSLPSALLDIEAARRQQEQEQAAIAAAVPSAANNPLLDSAADFAKEYEATLESQRRALTSTARELEEYKLIVQEVEPELRAKLLAEYDSIQALKDHKKAQEEANKAAKENRDHVLKTHDALYEQLQILKMGKDAFEQDQLEKRFGATPFELDMIAGLRDEIKLQKELNDEKEKQAKLGKEARDLAGKNIKDLEKEIKTFSMSAKEKALFEAQAKGATTDELAKMESLLEQLDMLKEEKKTRDDIAKALKDASKSEKERRELIKSSVDTVKAGSREAFQVVADSLGLGQFQGDMRGHRKLAKEWQRMKEALGIPEPNRLSIGGVPREMDPTIPNQPEREALAIQREELDLLRKMQQGIGDGLKIAVNEVTL